MLTYLRFVSKILRILKGKITLTPQKYEGLIVYFSLTLTRERLVHKISLFKRKLAKFKSFFYILGQKDNKFCWAFEAQIFQEVRI